MTEQSGHRRAIVCPRCGERKTKGTLCDVCLREVSPIVSGIKPIQMTLCNACDRVKLHHEWKRMSVEKAIEQGISTALSEDADAQIESVDFTVPEFEKKPGIQKTAVLMCTVGGSRGGIAYEEEYEVPVQYLVTTCPNCGKKGTSYFEGILQVRHMTPAVQQAIHEYVAAQKHKGLRIAKAVPVATGGDYYLSSQRAVNHLAKQLHANFGGELKISAQHFSYDHKAGKPLYRVNAYLEIPEFTKGTVIIREDRPFLILGVSAKVKAEDLKSGATVSFPYERGAFRPLPIHDMKVINTDPLEVYNPFTNQAVTPLNSKYAPAELDIGEIVSIALDGEQAFLIPRTDERTVKVKKRKRHGQKRGRKDDDLINPE
jgi:NMD protein affecting ribosome stability and mRNA decay